MNRQNTVALMMLKTDQVSDKQRNDSYNFFAEILTLRGLFLVTDKVNEYNESAVFSIFVVRTVG